MAHTTATKTYSQNTGTANTFSYSGSFDVFKATEVEVELDTVKLTYTASTINNSASPREYSVDVSAKTILIGGDPLTSGSVVIRPITDMGAPTPRATYTPGASITAADLNNNQTQLMRKAMEYGEQVLFNTGGTMTGDLTIGQNKTVIFEGTSADAYETTLTVTDPTADRTITLPNITGTVVTTGDTGTVATGMIAADAITGAKIADDQINSEHYIDGSIDAAHLASSSVTAAKIASDAVTGAKIADDAINSEHYTDGSIDTAHIADNQITTAKIVDANVTTAKIAADAITAAKIGDDVVNSEHIAAGAVDLEHMSANSVDSDQYVDGSIDTAHIADSQVTTAKIAADAITGAKVANDAIDSEHYTDGSIDTDHIADSQITTAKIAADAITAAKVADDIINSEHYAAASIDTEHIADGQVTAVKVASNAVTTAKITDSNVTTAKIADSNITLAKLASDLKQTSISDSDTQIPTSGAVVDYVAAQLAPIGGLEVIADDESFPNTIPAAGVVISITDAAGLQVNSSGVSTNGDALDNSTITINGFPSELRGGVGSNADPYVFQSGAGLMVQSTGSSHTYNYHQAMIRESDFVQLSDDINDFNSRYVVHNFASSNPSNPDEGDLAFDTNANKMKVYDGSSWGEVTSTGDFKYLVMTNAGTTNAATLNSSNVTFDLKESSTSGSAATVTSAAQLMVSVNGVIQKANTGTSASGLDGFVMADSDTITFCAAPDSGDDIFIVQFGSALTVNTPGDGTVATAKIASGAVTTAKIADANVTTAKLASDAVTGAKIADDAVGSEHIEVLDADLQMTDAGKIRLGTGNDLELYHNGTHSYLSNSTGNLEIQSDTFWLEDKTNGHGMIHAVADGAVSLYYDNTKKFETTSAGATLTGELITTGDIDPSADGGANLGSAAKSWYNLFLNNDAHFADNGQALFGSDDDFSLNHTGSHLYMTNTTGNWYIQPKSGETAIEIIPDGKVGLRYDNTTRIETTANGCSLIGQIDIADGSGSDGANHIRIGNSFDLRIYHDATDSFIANVTNKLRLTSPEVRIENSGATEVMAKFIDGGACELRYNDAAVFQTAEYGVIIKRPSGGETTLELIGCEGNDSTIYMAADDGDDVGDRWKMTAETDASNWKLFNAASGTWVESIAAHGNAHVLLSYQGSGKVETTSSGCTVYGSVNETSDRALKTNIEPLNNVLDKIQQITGYKYQFKDTGHDSMGVTAQDVEKVFPELVHGEEGTKTLQYSGLIGALIESVKELSNKVAALEAG